MRGATSRSCATRWSATISIHAPHAGRDNPAVSGAKGQMHFNPRAPCGARQKTSFRATHGKLFQSTRPMRGATIRQLTDSMVLIFQSTRPMRGATVLKRLSVQSKKEFQSTRPMRGATIEKNVKKELKDISIHAPHAGRDLRGTMDEGRGINFNPRAPCGARR